jgi:prophage antirepressor-like protein
MELQTFTNSGFKIRGGLDNNSKPYFVASDVCRSLGIANSRDAMSMLDDDAKGVGIADTLGGEQEVNIVYESGLYALIFKSRKEEAKKFRKWVTSEVLPSIQKNGFYSVPDNPLSLLAKTLDTLLSQQSSILTLLQEKALTFAHIDKPTSRMALRRLSNEEKFITRVQKVLKQNEGLKQWELLLAVGYRKDDNTALRWLHGYDGIYWRANIVGQTSPAYSYSLIEEV